MTLLNKILQYTGNLMASNSLTINNSSFKYPITLYKKCSIVMMTFTDMQGLTNGEHTLFTLPTGWRPVQDVYYLISSPLSTADDARMFITTNGVVSIYYYGSNTGALNFAETITWIAS